MLLSTRYQVILWAILLSIAGISDAAAQLIQLPIIRNFNVRTSVSVPDGGTMSLGGNASSNYALSSRGFGLGDSLANAQRSTSSVRALTSAKIIVLSEYEKVVLAEAGRRRASQRDPNGSEAVQQQADFITQHIGKTEQSKRPTWTQRRPNR